MCEVKRCYVCKATKPITEFGLQSRSKDGHRGECKSCRQLSESLTLDRRRAYKKANAERIAANTREWRARKAAHIAEYNERNKERFRLADRAYRERMSAARQAYNREYAQRYPERVRAKVVARRARKRNGQPVCLTPWDIDEMRKCYATARTLRELFAIDAHVDHILPLAGEDVCGLHVPWNLRIIDGTSNRKKATQWSPSDALSLSGTFEVCV